MLITTREDALQLAQVGRGLVGWARAAAKRADIPKKPNRAERLAAKALELERLLLLPVVANNAALKRFVVARAGGEDPKRLNAMKAMYRRLLKNERVGMRRSFGVIPAWERFESAVSDIQSTVALWGHAGDVVGVADDAYGEATLFPIFAGHAYRPSRVRFKQWLDDTESVDARPADLGFAYWSISDRTYHDEVKAHREIVSAEMKRGYTECVVPMFRGAALSSHLKVGEVVSHESVACFSTRRSYAEQIGSRSGVEGKYFYLMQVEASAQACSMDGVYRQWMGENEWRFAPATKFEVVAVHQESYYGHPMFVATLRPTCEPYADRELPYDRIQAEPKEEWELLAEKYDPDWV